MSLLRGSIRYIMLVVVTVTAVAVMVLVSIGSREKQPTAEVKPNSEKPELMPVALVAVEPITYDDHEIVDTFSGIIEPWERFALGFEVDGRVSELGKNESGEPLDDGDFVAAGTVLAKLDDGAQASLRDEAQARLTMTQSDLRRDREANVKFPGSVSESDIEQLAANVEIFQAQLDLAEKNLSDATLIAPQDAIISRRHINAGESVSPQQRCFDLVQTDRVILRLGVPESRIRAIAERMRQVELKQKLHADGVTTVPEYDLKYQVHIELAGEDRYGEKWPAEEGEVRHISNDADTTTGLFDVEITVDNADEHYRPGMIARARLVTDRVRGYRVPTPTVLFRKGNVSLFAYEPGTEAAAVSTSPTTTSQDNGESNAEEPYSGLARRVVLTRWIEQGGHVIIPESPGSYTAVISRGQHRLVDGQRVQLAEEEAPAETKPKSSAEDGGTASRTGPPKS